MRNSAQYNPQLPTYPGRSTTPNQQFFGRSSSPVYQVMPQNYQNYVNHNPNNARQDPFEASRGQSPSYLNRRVPMSRQTRNRTFADRDYEEEDIRSYTPNNKGFLQNFANGGNNISPGRNRLRPVETPIIKRGEGDDICKLN